MRNRPRRNHSLAFNAKAAIAAIRGDRTIAQIANPPATLTNPLIGGYVATEQCLQGTRGPLQLFQRFIRDFLRREGKIAVDVR